MPAFVNFLGPRRRRGTSKDRDRERYAGFRWIGSRVTPVVKASLARLGVLLVAGVYVVGSVLAGETA
jgi:hypothetical protein